METTLVEGKQLRRVQAQLLPEGDGLDAYEIHNGVTTGQALEHPLYEIDGRRDGAVSPDDQILGGYLHGLFDTPEACAALLARLGGVAETTIDYQQHRQDMLDRLADTVETSLNADALLETLEISPSDKTILSESCQPG
jgi:adenosylcobyric acid synthase